MSERLEGVALGGILFLGASYILHCKFNLGPWRCQKQDCRHGGNYKTNTTMPRKRG